MNSILITAPILMSLHRVDKKMRLSVAPPKVDRSLPKQSQELSWSPQPMGGEPQLCWTLNSSSPAFWFAHSLISLTSVYWALYCAPGLWSGGGSGDSVSALDELCLVVGKVHVVGASELQCWEQEKAFTSPGLGVWVWGGCWTKFLTFSGRTGAEWNKGSREGNAAIQVH